MPCYHPIAALQVGSEAPRLWPPLGTANLALPCGRCLGCKTARATQWARRCQHEASQYEHNTFITLTYADENLPSHRELQPERLQQFFKRLRKRATYKRGTIVGDHRRNIRYFACGEYGEKSGRPHYHAILFNAGFSDRRRVGKDLYESEILNDLWPYGSNRVGEATPAAASYIAQYSMKKQGGAGTIAEGGVWIPAPFLRMSLKPAIGADWLKQYKSDLTHGYVIDKGFKSPIPRTYKERLKREDPQFLEEVLGRVAQHISRTPSDRNNPDRLAAQEIIQRSLKTLNEKRTI